MDGSIGKKIRYCNECGKSNEQVPWRLFKGKEKGNMCQECYITYLREYKRIKNQKQEWEIEYKNKKKEGKKKKAEKTDWAYWDEMCKKYNMTYGKLVAEVEKGNIKL